MRMNQIAKGTVARMKDKAVREGDRSTYLPKLFSCVFFFPNQRIPQLPNTFYLRPVPYSYSLLYGSPVILILLKCVPYSSQKSWMQAPPLAPDQEGQSKSLGLGVEKGRTQDRSCGRRSTFLKRCLGSALVGTVTYTAYPVSPLGSSPTCSQHCFGL